jgi:glycosyltransferase involved in cell wall biosynthesis
MRSSVCLTQGRFYFFCLANERVSHVHSRENTVLRGELFERNDSDPSGLSVRRNVYVIPNALVADQFKPCPPKSSDTSKISALSLTVSLLKRLKVTIVVLSRLAYRKGIDLLVATAPRICAAFPNVRFVVGALLGHLSLVRNLKCYLQGETGQNSLTCYRCGRNIFSRIALSF